MATEHMWCLTCPIKDGCSPLLRPEVIRSSGYIDTNPKFKLDPHACRHSSCKYGLEEAGKARSGPSKKYTIYDAKGQNPEEINGAAFETSNSKPTKAGEYRIVEIENGRIFSLQDGMYLPTSQYSS